MFFDPIFMSNFVIEELFEYDVNAKILIYSFYS